MTTTGDLEARIRELEDRLHALEGAEERYAARVLDELFPSETRKHMRAAWKEQLLAIRSIVDHWIEKQEDGGTRGKRRESISVE